MYGLRLPNLTIRVAAFSCIAASLAFVVSFPFLVVPSALAAPLPVAVNPTRIEITASPGDQVESSFKFWNGTDADLPVHLEGFDIGPQDEEGHATVEGEDASNSLKAWLKPAYPDLNVAPKQEITLPFSLDIPANVDPGSHWGALLAITAPAAQSNGAAVNVRTGVILLVHVLGPVTEKLVIESVSVPRFASLRRYLLRRDFGTRGRCTKRRRERLRCEIFRGRSSQQERCLCGMCFRAWCGKWAHRSATADSGWGGTQFTSGRNTAMPARNFIAKKSFGWCPGGRRDGSCFSDWGWLSG